MKIKKSPQKKQKFTVWFSSKKINIEDLPCPGILIYASDNWNDFGLRTYCGLIVKLSDNKSFVGDVFAAFLGDEPSPHDLISTKIGRKKDSHILASQLPNFFTMFRDLQGYRNIVKELGVEGAKSVLTTIHDLVAFRHYGKSPKWFNTAIESKVFNLSFMRNSESFFTYHNAGKILGGLEEESLGKISNQLNLRFKLDVFENEHEFKFRFYLKSSLPKRLCVLIGKNGLGKSQALSKLVSSALKNDGSLSDPEHSRPMISRILAIATPGETQYTFPIVNQTRGRIHYRRLLLTRGGKPARSEGLGDLIVQLARSSESIKKQDRWNLFLESLQAALPLNEIGLPLRKEETNASIIKGQKDQVNYIRLVDIPRGGEQASLERWKKIHPTKEPIRVVNGKSYSLSSGQLSFLQFAAQACLFIENATLVLLDEPETHLHPNLITDFIKLLDRLLELTGSIAILATHSPYFVREVFRPQVFVLKDIISENKRFIEVSNPRLKTFGADVGAISFFVFEDEITNRLIGKVKKSLGRSPNKQQELLDIIRDELSTEAVMMLKRELNIGEKK